MFGRKVGVQTSISSTQTPSNTTTRIKVAFVKKGFLNILFIEFLEL